MILHGNVNMQLPNLWLWEMIDEFIYQFQSFCQFRGKLSSKTKEELKALDECDAKGPNWSAESGAELPQADGGESPGSPPRSRRSARGEMKFSESGGVRLRRLQRPAHARVLLAHRAGARAHPARRQVLGGEGRR